MTLALVLAKRINSVAYNELPPEAIHWAKVGILDLVGVTLAGAHEDTTKIPRDILLRGATTGSSPIFGTTTRTGPLDAALVNGTASHALDFDDCNNTIGGHPSAPILPALWTLATGASGRSEEPTS